MIKFDIMSIRFSIAKDADIFLFFPATLGGDKVWKSLKSVYV